jgi:hypothetical protein
VFITTKVQCCGLALMTLVGAAAFPGSVRPAELSPFMKPIAGTQTTTPDEVAARNVLALNTTMFELYGDAALPLGSNYWLTLITPGAGAASLAGLP